MKLGIVGLPNVGKSTLFNAITKAGAQSANYPFCTIEPNIGVVTVPDERLNKLADMYQPEKITPTAIEFVDIAGLVKGASNGEGLGNKFLSHIREVDAIVHMVRCFKDQNVTHVDGSIDPIRDIETITLELIFADLESLERRLVRTEKIAKSGDKQSQALFRLLVKIKENLENNIPVRNMEFTEEEMSIAEHLSLLTSKPVIYVANIDEEDIGKEIATLPLVQKVVEYAKCEKSEALVICAEIEEEIAQLESQDKKLFLQELGISQSGLDQLIKACYKLLGLISFLTAGPQEVRAWTVVQGTKAPQAAGKIHSDFERGFIRAEVIPYNTLMEIGSANLARDKGLIRSEGKDYVIRDGDVVLFRFNV